MEVEKHVQPFLPAPFDHPVEHVEARTCPDLRVILRGEELVVERHPYDVHPECLDEGNVFLSDVNVTVSIPESPGLGRADELLDNLLDLPRRDGLVELEHVPFGDEPVTQIDSPQNDGLSIWIHQPGAVYRYKGGGRFTPNLALGATCR